MEKIGKRGGGDGGKQEAGERSMRKSRTENDNFCTLIMYDILGYLYVSDNRVK